MGIFKKSGYSSTVQESKDLYVIREVKPYRILYYISADKRKDWGSYRLKDYAVEIGDIAGFLDKFESFDFMSQILYLYLENIEDKKRKLKQKEKENIIKANILNVKFEI